MMEVMKIRGPPSKDPMHVLLHLLPANLQQATTDPHLHWRLLDTSRQVWVSLLWGHCSFSWVLVHTSFCVSSKSYSQSYVSSGSSVVGLMVTSSMRASTIPRSAAPRALVPVHAYLPMHTWTGDDQTQFCLSLCGVPGSWSTQGFVWALWASLTGMGFDSKHESPPYHLAGASPLSSGVGYLLTAAPAPTILLGFPWPWTWGISVRPLQHHTQLPLHTQQILGS